MAIEDAVVLAAALDKQIEACQAIFRKPLAVLAGEAGTGKSTIVKAILGAIEKAHGAGAGVQLLAPTGKAADRLRERTGRDARTIHSFLASQGWLNDNLQFKPRGGRREGAISTYIVDEASMLDLTLFATLVRFELSAKMTRAQISRLRRALDAEAPVAQRSRIAPTIPSEASAQ